MSYKRFNFYCGGELYNELNMPKSGTYTETNLPVTAKSKRITSLDLTEDYWQVYYIIDLPKGDTIRCSDQYSVTSISLVENGVTISDPLYDVGAHPVASLLSIETITSNQLIIYGNISRPYADGNYSTSELAAITTTVTLSVEYTFYEMFIPQSDSVSLESLDQLANNYVKNMSACTVALSGSTLTATFTPCTDEKLLDAVDNGDVTVRLQLMKHAPGGTGLIYGEKTLHHYTSPIFTVNPKPSYADSGNHNISPASTARAFLRVRSHDPDYYGHSWLNLSKVQLQSGSAVLTNVTNINSMQWTHDGYWVTKEALAVEIFCAAIGRKGKDPFFYERGGYRKLSSNVAEYNI